MSDDITRLNEALADRYAIERELGQGGMATVYLARDLKHDRQVAVKVLKAELGAVLGVQRFLDEIKVTAKLQHPNLLPLFDSGEADGLLFYVMPFVDGETLGARMEREKQLPIDETIRISAAIAGALDYAHKQGVIHRDLKPDNILMQSGQPVIADFGIALAVSKAGGARVTQTGMSLGTPQYMSPEQAMGDRDVDGRTDIYSLGAMTYEMLAGEPPHMGATSQSIIAKVVTERPPSISVTRPSVSDEVAYAVDRALEKLPADRWSTAADFAEALQGKKVTRTFGSRAAQSAKWFSSTRMRALLAVMTLVALGGVGGTWYFASRPPVPVVIGRFPVVLPESVTVGALSGTHMAISRDGTQLVVVGTNSGGQRGLYLRRMDDPVAQVVRGADSASSPTFSPDGNWLVFKSLVALKKVAVVGGTPQILSDSVGRIGSWGDGDALVFNKGNDLWAGTAQGRDARRLVGPDTARKIFRMLWPEVLPGGKYALVTIDRSPGANVPDSLVLGVVSLKDGLVTELNLAGSNPHYAEPGSLVFGRSNGRGIGLVLAAPFSVASRRVTGPAEIVMEDVFMGSGGAVGFAVSNTGVLAFQGGLGAASRLVVVDRSGAERAIPGDPGRFFDPRVSPDGKRVAVTIREAGNEVVWIVDLSTGARTRLTPDSVSTRPEWTRDGTRVAFLRRAPGPGFMRPFDGSGADVPLWRAAVYSIGVGAPGGPWAFRRQPVGGQMNVFVAPADTLDAMRALVATNSYDGHPRISPDGKLLALVSEESGKREVYVQPFPGPGARVRISVSGGDEPNWAPDGSSVFYRDGAHLVSAVISDRPQLRIVKQDSLFVDRYARDVSSANYDVFPNGRGILMVKPLTGAQASEIDVIMNWPQLLRARAGATGR